MDLPFYVHQLDPVLFRLGGPFAVRWYGLAYVAAFFAAFFFLRRWSRAGSFRVAPDQLHALILYVVAGVMLGARLGFLFFYDFPQWREDPALLFRVWQGGMSSHGGMIGLALAMLLFARRRYVPLLHVTDALACVAPLGIFFGRLANFINGELWGRVTSVRWAVLFPQEAGLYPPIQNIQEEVARLYEAGVIQPRHPSQLYAAAVEGLLLWAVMMGGRQTAWAQKGGRLSALFLVVYAAGRISVEFFRQPEITYFGWLTQGQLLSLLLLIPAAVLLARSFRRS